MSGDHGAKALGPKLHAEWIRTNGPADPERLLGEHGLFVEDVREHEPITATGNWPPIIDCKCGWRASTVNPESYFDHIGTQP